MLELIAPDRRRYPAKSVDAIRDARASGKIDDRWSVCADDREQPVDEFLNRSTDVGVNRPLGSQVPILVHDYRESLTASGEPRRSFHCPGCNRALVSLEERFDNCPNCELKVEFSAGVHALDDPRERVRGAQSYRFWTPLRRWLAVAIGVHAIVGVLIGQTVVAAVLSDTSAISLILVTCYGVALARSFWDILHISGQTLKARRQVLTLVKGGRIRKLLEQCEDSLMRDHITNLYEISRRSTEISQDNLVVLLQSRLHARIRLTEIAGGVLVTIGLVGTIVGLISSFSGIGVVLDNVGEDRRQLLSGFRSTLGGMGTAFYTTLLGSVLGGVVMRVLNTIVVSSTDALISHIAELTEVYILPTIRSSAQRRGGR